MIASPEVYLVTSTLDRRITYRCIILISECISVRWMIDMAMSEKIFALNIVFMVPV